MVRGGLIRGVVLVSSVVAVATASCGRSSKSGGGSRETAPDAGEKGAAAEGTGGGVSTGGSGAQGGTAGAGMAGSQDGGETSEGGAPAGGGGAMTGGVSGGGSSNAGASNAGAAGTPGVRVPDGCEAGSQLVGGAYCSTEMTCDARRMNVSCSEVAGLWSCSCSDAEGRVDYEFPGTSGVRTCEIAARACADPELLTGNDMCVRMHSESAAACSIHDDCQRLHEIDGVTLRTKTVRNASCQSCDDRRPASCCRCTPSLAVNYRLLDIDLAAGCNFLGDLCKPDGFEEAGVKDCETISETTYPGACGIEVECGQPIELDDGTRLSLAENLWIGCGPRYPDNSTEPDGMICTCRDQNGGYELALTTEMPVNLSLCRAMGAACVDLLTIEPTGKPSCASERSMMANACSVDGQCAQPATMGGLNVEILTNINVHCERQAGDVWACYCTQAGGSVEVEAADSDGACDLGVAACPTTPATQ